LVVKIERISKKNAAELLMKAGLSSYMGEKLTRFVLELRKLARERGYDISKFI
jgi:hypothetical protein